MTPVWNHERRRFSLIGGVTFSSPRSPALIAAPQRSTFLSGQP
jgi:hypothetical protein